MTTSVPLSNGLRMPQIGLGVYLISDIAVCESSVQSALETGYRLIDTAIAYRNERAVGRGLRASAVPREEIFLTTKLWPSHYKYDKARVAIAESVKRLDSDYIDLLLLHQPVGDIHGAWRAMEEAVDEEQSAPSASATSPWPTWTICFQGRGSRPSWTRLNCIRIGSSPSCSLTSRLIPSWLRRGIPSATDRSLFSPSPRSSLRRPSMGSRRCRSFCAGTFSAGSSPSPNRPTPSTSRRTSTCSTLNSRPRRCRPSTQ